jgi:hypothetical protein
MSERDQEYRDCAERVAREVLGDPNRQLSNSKELRWGTHGSMKLNLEDGTFYCHETKDGGGVRWFLHYKLNLDDPGVDEFLKTRRYVTFDRRPNGDGRQVRRKIVAIHDYRDIDGSLVFQVVRFDPKDFRQRRPNGSGGYTWTTKGVRQVPYRLPELMEAMALTCLSHSIFA